jgi:hypothetical protein
MDTIRLSRWIVVWSVVLILVLSVLEFPPPLGFESRPQDNVSGLWLVLFLTILISEIATIPLIFKRPRVGGAIGMLAAVLNVFQIIADQTHIMQTEAAPLSYNLLEYSVGAASLILGIFSWHIWRRSKQY